MTTATIQPTGINGLAVQFGSALVKWGRIRAQRSIVRRERLQTMLRIEQTIAEREHATRRYGIAN